MSKVELGDIVKDLVTGFEGVCVAKTMWMFGCARVGVQSNTLKEGAPTDMQMFDDNQMTVLKKGAIARENIQGHTVGLGDKVRDRLTGYTGICIAQSEQLFAANRIGVQSETLKDGIPAEAQWFDEPQVQVIKEKAVKIDEEKQEQTRKTGGPRPDPVRPTNPTR